MPSSKISIPREAHPWRWAFVWGTVLAVIFFGTYNNINRYTATLEPVASFFFAWELQIPFWPWTIVPYWSIDLFYGLALFLASSKAVLMRLVKRLLLAQFLCISGFLLFPLKFAWVRPPTEGIFEKLFTALAQFDLPYNQAPSLHIVLLVVLWFQYRLYVSAPLWRFVVDVWSGVIAVSVLTTWQHHFIDVITGVWVGVFCLLAIPEQACQWRWVPGQTLSRSRLAGWYGLGGAIWLGFGWLFWPAAIASACVWIGAALLYVGGVYLWGSSAHLGKRTDGVIPFFHYVFLGPYYLGAHLNARWHLRRHPHYSEILPGVYLGALAGQKTLHQQLKRAAPDRWLTLLDFTAELARPPQMVAMSYQSLPHLDLLPLDVGQLTDAAGQIELACKEGAVLAACALGASRSAAAMAAWLILYRDYSLDDALSLISHQRPYTRFPLVQREYLLRLATDSHSLGHSSTTQPVDCVAQ